MDLQQVFAQESSRLILFCYSLPVQKAFEQHCSRHQISICPKWQLITKAPAEEQLQRMLLSVTKLPLPRIQYSSLGSDTVLLTSSTMWGLRCQGEVILFDPCGPIATTLSRWGVSPNQIKGIVLTKYQSPDIVELIFISSSLWIVTHQYVRSKLQRDLIDIFLFNQTMLKNKLHFLIISVPHYTYKFRFISLCHGKQYLDVGVKLRKIRLYYDQIKEFPQEAINPQFEAILFPDVDSKIKHEIKQLPQIYRKKLMKINKGQQCRFICKGQENGKSSQKLYLKYENKAYCGLQYRHLAQQSVLNAIQLVGMVIRGQLFSQQNKSIYGIGDCFEGESHLYCSVPSTVLTYTMKEHSFYNEWRKIKPMPLPTQLLIRAKDNSFVQQLHQKHIQSQKASFNFEPSIYFSFNEVCSVENVESGSLINIDGKIFFVLKGEVKLINEREATRNMGFGYMRDHFSNVFGHSAEIVKDSQLLSIDLNKIKDLFNKCPQLMYQMCCLSNVFR